MAQTTNNPLVSVVIITRDRPQSLQNCIRSILDNTYKQIEIVILDNGSETSRQITRAFLSTLNAHCPIKYIETSPKGFAVLRQESIEQTAGEIVMSIDDDCMADSEAIAHIVTRFATNPKIGIVGGDITNVGFAATQAFKGRARIGINGRYENIEDPREAEVFGSANMSFRKKAFDLVGGYDLFCNIGFEEMDLTLNIKRIGYTVVYDPAVKITHIHVPSSFSRSRLNNTNIVRLYLYFKYFMPKGIVAWGQFLANEFALLYHETLGKILRKIKSNYDNVATAQNNENRAQKATHYVIIIFNSVTARILIPILAYRAYQVRHSFRLPGIGELGL